MAGSLVWRTYTTDGGVASSVFRDESNSEATSGSAPLLGAFASGNPGLNSLVKPRYVNAQLSTDALRRKKFIVGTLTIFNAIGAGATLVESGTNGGTWNITSKVGERSRIPVSTDTGQTDGDAT